MASSGSNGPNKRIPSIYQLPQEQTGQPLPKAPGQDLPQSTSKASEGDLKAFRLKVYSLNAVGLFLILYPGYIAAQIGAGYELAAWVLFFVAAYKWSVCPSCNKRVWSLAECSACGQELNFGLGLGKGNSSSQGMPFLNGRALRIIAGLVLVIFAYSIYLPIHMARPPALANVERFFDENVCKPVPGAEIFRLISEGSGPTSILNAEQEDMQCRLNALAAGVRQNSGAFCERGEDNLACFSRVAGSLMTQKRFPNRAVLHMLSIIARAEKAETSNAQMEQNLSRIEAGLRILSQVKRHVPLEDRPEFAQFKTSASESTQAELKKESLADQILFVTNVYRTLERLEVQFSSIKTIVQSSNRAPAEASNSSVRRYEAAAQQFTEIAMQYDFPNTRIEQAIEKVKASKR